MLDLRRWEGCTHAHTAPTMNQGFRQGAQKHVRGILHSRWTALASHLLGKGALDEAYWRDGGWLEVGSLHATKEPSKQHIRNSGSLAKNVQKPVGGRYKFTRSEQAQMKLAVSGKEAKKVAQNRRNKIGIQRQERDLRKPHPQAICETAPSMKAVGSKKQALCQRVGLRVRTTWARFVAFVFTPPPCASQAYTPAKGFFHLKVPVEAHCKSAAVLRDASADTAGSSRAQSPNHEWSKGFRHGAQESVKGLSACAVDSPMLAYFSGEGGGTHAEKGEVKMQFAKLVARRKPTDSEPAPGATQQVDFTHSHKAPLSRIALEACFVDGCRPGLTGKPSSKGAISKEA
jgi:hypothetical protein